MLLRPGLSVGLFLAVAILSSCALPLGTRLQGQNSNPVFAHAIAPDPAASLPSVDGWERKNTTLYQLWVSSFKDSDGDGIGDLAGITAEIQAGYFTDLGVNAIWLSPIFKAASLSSNSGNKHGYDTIDYTMVAPIYGDNAKLKTLIETAHDKGIRVIFDFVPNHTSSANPWFSDLTKKDWYVRRDSKPSGWTGFDSYSDWYGTGPYYYGVFGSTMPDLNYRDTDVSTTMTNVAIDWLNFGFDGMRVDAVKYLFEGSSDTQWKDQPETYAWFEDLRSKVIDAYPGYAKFMVAEDWDPSMANVESYLENGGRKGFNMCLDFIWPYALVQNLDGSGAGVPTLLHHLVDDNNALPQGSSFGVFESNHDNVVSRPAIAFGGDGDKIYLAAALSILGKGTPIVYYGNEIGMTGSSGSDSNLRQPFDWSAEASESADADSLWSWNADLLKLRSGYAAWNDPSIVATSSSATGVLAFEITGSSGKQAVVVANTSSSAITSPFTVQLSNSATTETALIGDGTGSSINGASLSVATLPAYTTRVYALDDPGATPIRASDENYSGYASVLPPLPQLYLRGSFNGWAAGITLNSQGNGLYSASYSLPTAGAVLFKYGSADWSTALGFSNMIYDPTRTGALGAACVQSDNTNYDNIEFTPPSAASYQFWLDTTQNPYRYWIQ
ncbi:MAG TPA: alpha-amylase family glycosyl hydrolase [Rectinemataceae bacterium]|nr:alpha-amylase family glycosyl hydrolase [Rectinemataceae bacterium]